MQTLIKRSVLTALGVALLALPASAGNTKSFTKSTAGLSYKLTTPNPLPMGEQKLSLRVMRGGQVLKGANLTAQIMMDDGMKSPVKITPKANGELELKTTFSMGGDWQLVIKQSAPVKAEVKFDLMVSGGSHSGHHM